MISSIILLTEAQRRGEHEGKSKFLIFLRVLCDLGAFVRDNLGKFIAFLLLLTIYCDIILLSINSF